MATIYTVIVQQSQDELKQLRDNNYDLAIAKSVAIDDDSAIFNTIFQSKSLSEEMSLSWQEVYGLNFSMEVPTKGTPVTLSGAWQPCSFGSGFIINEDGRWSANDNKSGMHAQYLNVLNKFQGIYIVVGTLNPDSNQWQPIYHQPFQSPKGTTSAYQPQEKVQLWFGREQKSGSVIWKQSTKKITHDMGTTADADYTHYFKWHTDGSWSDQATPFVP